MVEINKNDRSVTIKIENCSVNDLINMQTALIDLVKSYRYDVYGLDAASSVFDGLTLLEAILPNHEQQTRGFIKDTDCLELPENMNKKQRQTIDEALYMIANPEVKIRAGKNPVLEALKNLE